MSIKKLLANVNLTSVKRDYAWYTVATMFNCEESYIRNLKDAVSGAEIEDYISEYFVPFKYVKEEGSTKIKKLKGDYSGYVFVKCILTSKVWNTLRATQGCAVVLTTGGIPHEVSEESINLIREQVKPVGLSDDELAELNKELDRRYKCMVLPPVVSDSDFNTDFQQ